MTSKFNWDRHSRRQKMDEYFRSTDNRVRFGYNLLEKQEKEANKWLDRHPEHNQKQDLHTKAMKMASQLYKRLQTDPDFRDDDKTELWQLALKTAKQKIGL